MLMKKTIIAFAALCLLASCGQEPNTVEPESHLFKIEPIITRATDMDFEPGDRVGTSIVRDESVWAGNVALNYDGSIFQGDLCWYLEPEDSCSIIAYYPYCSDGVPSAFSVQEDQAGGVSASDLMTACKHGVYPTVNAIDMVFKHRLTKLWITVANASGEDISAVELGGSIPSARVDVESGAVEVSDAGAVSISACRVKGDTLWQAIVVPQVVAFEFSVELASGKVLTQSLKEMDLQQGTCYNISAVVYNDNVKVVTSGQIQDWLDGGDIPGIIVDPDTPETPHVVGFEEFEDHFMFDGVDYPTVKLKDGKTWMASNLRYVPEGMTPCKDTSDHFAGIYCPVKSSVMTDDPEVVAELGYLYTAEIYLGLKFKDISGEDDLKAVEGTQGICPTGWHIPTQADWLALVGKLVDLDTNTDAPYYSSAKGNALISLINEDGFNLKDSGYAIFSYTSANTYRCQWGKSNPFLAGSSLGYDKQGKARITLFKEGDTGIDAGAPGTIKSIMLRGLLIFPGNDTCNGSNIQYTGAYPVRCVKDQAAE